MKKIYPFYLYCISLKKNTKSLLSLITTFLTIVLGCTLQGYSLEAPAGPTITVGSLATFDNQCINTASEIQSYTVSGTSLTSAVVITPPAGFEISVTGGSFFDPSPYINLHPNSGSIEGQTIYVRFKPASAQAYSASITHTSTGATTQNVAVTGTGIASPVTDFTGTPTTITAGGNVTFTDLSANSPTSWLWSFPGGSPSSSIDQNPMVTYDVAGTYSVSLTATTGCGSDTETKTDYIEVTALCITPVATAPSAGNGTSGNPYQIATLENLYWISAPDAVVASPSQATRFGAHYIQTAPIDASATASWCNGGWNPIGYYNDDNWYVCSFRGTYDGQEHTISGLHMESSSPQRVFGLFGRMVDATIQNLGIINVEINNVNGSSGALAGYAESSTINNCYSSGNIIVSSNTSDDAGGLIGDLFYNSTITDCYSTCNVSAPYFAGGLAGHNNNSSISTSYFMTGTVTGLNSYSTAGGLVGYNNYNAIISRCFSSVGKGNK